jgi:hypothetical protein
MQGTEKSSKVEWIEVKEAAEPAKQTEAGEINGCLYIEYGALRMTADRGYPIESLTTLLREMCGG